MNRRNSQLRHNLQEGFEDLPGTIGRYNLSNIVFVTGWGREDLPSLGPAVHLARRTFLGSPPSPPPSWASSRSFPGRASFRTTYFKQGAGWGMARAGGQDKELQKDMPRPRPFTGQGRERRWRSIVFGALEAP